MIEVQLKINDKNGAFYIDDDAKHAAVVFPTKEETQVRN
jgi:hypothetical protein